MLKQIIETYEMSGFFQLGMPKLKMWLWTFEKLLHLFLPRLHKHLNDENVPPTLYATHWFLTAFVYSLPFHVVLRIWDIFLFYGSSILFSVGLGLLKMFEEQLLSLKFDEVMSFLKFNRNEDRSLIPRIDPDQLIELAIRFRIKPEKIDQLEKSYIPPRNSRSL